MGTTKPSGLVLRGKTWHIDKHVRGFGRICCSTGTSSRAEAEAFFINQLKAISDAQIHGVRLPHSFREAAIKYVEDHLGEKKSIERDLQDLELLSPYVGDMQLKDIHNGSFDKFKADRKAQGRKDSTVNRSLRIAQLVLRLAAGLWRDQFNRTWLESPPIIKLLGEKDKRKPYPLDFSEYAMLSAQLPSHLRPVVRFAVNTGCREQEICQLRWDWEVPVPELGTSVFLIPGEFTKNAEDKLVVLNRHARKAVERARGRHPEFVFTYPVAIHLKRRDRRSPIVGYERRPFTKIYNSGWKLARVRMVKAYRRRFEAAKKRGEQAGGFEGFLSEGLINVRVHDLRHTFGQRLRATGASLEVRQDLLGHKSGRITTEYCAAQIRELLDVVEKICDLGSRKNPAISVLRIKDRARIRRNTLNVNENIGGDEWNRTTDLSIMSAAL